MKSRINDLIRFLNKIGHNDKAKRIFKMSEDLGESMVDVDELGESFNEEPEYKESLTKDAIVSELKNIRFPIKGNYKGLSWEVKRLRNKSATHTFIFNWSGSGIDEEHLKPLFYKGGNYNKLKLEMFAHRGEGDAPVYTKLLDMLHSDEVDYSQVSDTYYGEYRDYGGDPEMMNIRHGMPTVKPKEQWANPDEPEYINSWSQDVRDGKIDNKDLENKMHLLVDAIVHSMNKYIKEILMAYDYVKEDLELAYRQTRFSGKDSLPYNLESSFEMKKFEDLKSLGEVTESNLVKTLQDYTQIWETTRMPISNADLALQRAFENSIVY